MIFNILYLNKFILNNYFCVMIFFPSHFFMYTSLKITSIFLIVNLVQKKNFFIEYIKFLLNISIFIRYYKIYEKIK